MRTVDGDTRLPFGFGSGGDGGDANGGRGGKADASNAKQTAANINAALGGDPSANADASNSHARSEGTAHANPYASANAEADASARSHATNNNQHQNNLNKSVQVGGESQSHNGGNIAIGIQSVVAQQMNATSASSSMIYGGQTLQGNAIAVNAFHN